MYADQENAMMDSYGKLREKAPGLRNRNIFAAKTVKNTTATLASRDRSRAQVFADRTSQCSSVLSDVSNTLNNDTFHRSLLSNVQVSYPLQVSRVSSKRKNAITVERLAQNWNIGIDAAKRTLWTTTQRAFTRLPILLSPVVSEQTIDSSITSASKPTFSLTQCLPKSSLSEATPVHKFMAQKADGQDSSQ
jgi:hypothetical protein